MRDKKYVYDEILRHAKDFKKLAELSQELIDMIESKGGYETYHIEELSHIETVLMSRRGG